MAAARWKQLCWRSASSSSSSSARRAPAADSVDGRWCRARRMTLTSRSSTLWSRSADTSMNLQPRFEPSRLPSASASTHHNCTEWQRRIYTHTAPQVAYRSCSGASCVTDTAGVQHVSSRLSLRPQTLNYDQTAIRSLGLPFNGLQPRNPCNYKDYFLIYRPRRDGRLSWPGWLTDSGHFTREVGTCQP